MMQGCNFECEKEPIIQKKRKKTTTGTENYITRRLETICNTVCAIETKQPNKYNKIIYINCDLRKPFLVNKCEYCQCSYNI